MVQCTEQNSSQDLARGHVAKNSVVQYDIVNGDVLPGDYLDGTRRCTMYRTVHKTLNEKTLLEIGLYNVQYNIMLSMGKYCPMSSLLVQAL